MTRRAFAVGVAAALGLCGAAAASAQPVRAGVTTHFSQGWPLRLIDDAVALGASSIRDSVHWAAVERSPGRFEFTARNSGHVARACAMGMSVLLGLEPRNPLYDGGQTVWTPIGQAAFARYVRAVAERWPDCVIAVEIGNEINGKGGMTGPAAANRAAAHVSLLRAVYQSVKPEHPRLALLGGSVNTVATGFLARLFAAGALEWVDGIAVHPYRPEPEGLDRELARVRAAMLKAGRLRPLWATEFSRAFADPAEAADWQLKATMLVESAGVANHYWYALADQPVFPTMGLVRWDGSRKPAGRAFAFAARELAAVGAAQRVDHGDPTLFHFRVGAETQVVWGTARSLSVPPGARAFAADGSPLALPDEVAARPVVIRGAPAIGFGPSQVLADSFLGFGEAPLAWFARRTDGTMLPLAWVDWDWTSYLGHSAMPRFAVNSQGIGTLPGVTAVVRYTAPPGLPGLPGTAERVTAGLCLSPNGPAVRAQAALVSGGRVLWQEGVGPLGAVRVAVAANLASGGAIDLVLAPQPGAAAARFHYRLQVSRGSAEAPPC